MNEGVDPFAASKPGVDPAGPGVKPARSGMTLRSLGFLFYSASVLQSALIFVGLLLPRFTSFIEAITSGTVISIALWALLEAQKAATADAVLKLTRSRWLVGAAIVGTATVILSFFIHPIHVHCGQDAALDRWRGSDDDVFRCVRGQVRLRWAISPPWQIVTISEGRDHLGKRASVDVGMLQAATFHYPADFAPPPFVLVFPDQDALIMTSPSNPSTFTVGVAGSTERVPLTGAGVLIGAHAVPDSARGLLKDGDPKPLQVELIYGEPLELLVFYKGTPCSPMKIDPAENSTWTFSFASCPH